MRADLDTLVIALERGTPLADVLRGLAEQNPGLCIVTTREKVVDLTRWTGYVLWDYRRPFRARRE